MTLNVVLTTSLAIQKPYIEFASIHWNAIFMGYFSGNDAADKKAGKILETMHQTGRPFIACRGMNRTPDIVKLEELGLLRMVCIQEKSGKQYYCFTEKSFFKMSGIIQRRRGDFPMTPEAFAVGVIARRELIDPV